MRSQTACKIFIQDVLNTEADERIRNLAMANLIECYESFNALFQVPASASAMGRVRFWRTAHREAVQRQLFYSKRLSYRSVSSHPEWREAHDRWKNIAAMARGELMSAIAAAMAE